MRETSSAVAVEIHRGRRHLVLRVDDGDGHARIRKTVRPRVAIRNASARLRHEYAVLRVLDASAVPNVPRPLGLEEGDAYPTLVLEDAGPRNLGERLRHRALPQELFLDMAIQLARIVADLHRHRVIHRDINPSNIVVGADGRSLTLVDFGLATHVVAVSQPAAVGELAGTLSYIAPEQTGRVDRALDHRADLYSLGATLYEMLTGGPPFQCEDPAELVHAHLAWTPAPPTARNPDVSEVLSNIVMRLLAKMPEQRYQSGEALLSDLEEAQRQWAATRAIAPFELGRFDLAQGLLAPTSVHGRQGELAALTAAFERVRAGASELVLLSGPAGIGKSRLVETLRGELEGRARFLAGKSDALTGNLPYGALVGPLRAFFRGVLRESAHVVDRWRTRVAAALGPSGGLVVELLPELRLLIGETVVPAAVGPVATENRFRLALQALVQALPDNGEPLVLFLDDLQWADAPTLALIERLVSAPDAHHLLVLAACRDEDAGAVPRAVEAAGKAGAAVQTIALEPLDVSMLTGVVAESLRCAPEVARPLAELLRRKTAGNPYFTERFLRLLHRSGLLTFDDRRGAWSWDLAGAEALAVTENVVDLMVGALAKLTPETTQLLTVAACMRARIDLSLLAAVVGQPVDETARRLWGVLRDGLLVPERVDAPAGAPAEEDASYRFAHDRVRQAAYSLLDERARQEIHLAVGRRLRERSGTPVEDGVLFDVVDQLNRGADLMASADERLQLAELGLLAADRARTSGSLGPALDYARRAIAVLPPDSRSARRPLWLSLHRAAAECAFCQGSWAEGEALFGQALEHAETTLEKAELHAVRVSAESMRNAVKAAVVWGREGLRLLGHALPEEITAETVAREVAAVRERLRGRSVAEIIERPLVRDPQTLAALDLLRRMALNTQLSEEKLWSIVVVRIVALTLERGNAPASAVGYVGVGVLIQGLPGGEDEGNQLAGAGAELGRRLRDPTTECFVLNTFAVLSNHWHAPLRANLPLLRRAVETGLESGEFQNAGWASASMVSFLFHSGVELARVESECAAAVRLMKKTGQGALLPFVEPYRRTIRQLQVPRREQEDAGAPATARHAGGAMAEHPMALVAPCLLRDSAELAARLRSRSQLFQFSPGLGRTVAASWFALYSSLGASLVLDDASPDDRESLRKVLVENQRALAGWAEHCPENFRHRADLVAAELARQDGHLDQALPLYDQAIEGARRQKFLHEEALAYELAGRCRARVGLQQTAGAYLQDARAAYARWGAAAKVDALDEEFPALAVGPSHAAAARAISSSSDESALAVLDLQSLLKATETLSGEVVLDRLLEKLIAVCLEVAGARHGALVLDQGGQLQVRARGVVSEPVALEPAALSVSQRVPPTLIEQVFRHGEPVALGDAARHGDFTGDPYFAACAVKSALAMPIRQHGRSVGVLYLENDLTTHAFPPERVRVLGLLSSQIAISLENSRLFEDLKVEIEDRTRAERAVRFLAEASAALSESLDYRTTLAEVARLAVPFLGDWCSVDVLEPDGKMSPVAAVHVDPALQEPLRELRAAFPVVDDPHLPSAETVRTGAPVLIAEVSEDRMVAAVSDPRHRELIRAIGARSVMAVPLVARGRPLGAITVAATSFARRYGPADVALAQELARRAAIAIDNARLYQEAQQAVRLRDEFLTVASHELNTPVAALRLTVAPFTGDASPPPDTVNRLLRIVDRQTSRLANLIGEMLDVSRVQAGAFHMHIQAIDLTEVVRETVHRLEGALAQARCPVSMDLDDRVMGQWDRAALDRVLTNLLSNAMKFGGGEPIEVALRASPTRAGLTVRDHGIGIEPGHLPRIFDRFARGVSAAHYGGLGLGLYIARVIVTGLGGSISADSTPGQGATFTVDLPRGGS